MTQQTELGVEIEAPTTAVAVIREPGINQLMALAIEKEGAIEVIERLAALRESEMAREAEHEFMQAFAEFKGRCPAIPRNKKGKEFAGKGGVKSYIMYAPLDTAQMIVDPILFGLGFSYWWTSEATAEAVVTTCHLRHVGGHERTSSMALPITTIPQSTKAQEHGGTRTMNKRLTLEDVLGLQLTDDVDGADGNGRETLSVEQVAEIQSLILRAGSSEAAVLKVGKADSLEGITQDRYDLIVDTLKVKAIRRETEAAT
jgi:hypothetical protein